MASRLIIQHHARIKLEPGIATVVIWVQDVAPTRVLLDVNQISVHGIIDSGKTRFPVVEEQTGGAGP